MRFLLKDRAVMRTVTALMLLVVLIAAAWSRNIAWRSEVTILRDALAKSPFKERVLYNLGGALAIEKKYGEALVYFTIASRINPARSEYHNQLGAIYEVLGSYALAEQEYGVAIFLSRENKEAYYNLANVLAKEGKAGAAAGYYKKFISLAGTLYPEQVASAKQYIASHGY